MIDKLRKLYRDIDDIRILNEWEAELSKISEKEKYSRMEITKQILKHHQSEIDAINYTLLYKKDLKEQDRNTLLAVRDVYSHILNMLDKDRISKDKEAVIEKINDAIKRSDKSLAL